MFLVACSCTNELAVQSYKDLVHGKYIHEHNYIYRDSLPQNVISVTYKELIFNKYQNQVIVNKYERRKDTLLSQGSRIVDYYWVSNDQVRGDIFFRDIVQTYTFTEAREDYFYISHTGPWVKY